MTQNQRRAAITAELVERTGIDEAMIERLVRAFYGRIRRDPLLAPVFAERIDDWEPHLQRMCAFWSSVALLTGRITRLTDHLRVHKHDEATRRGLLGLVGHRRRLLHYLNGQDVGRYRSLINKLGLRR